MPNSSNFFCLFFNCCILEVSTLSLKIFSREEFKKLSFIKNAGELELAKVGEYMRSTTTGCFSVKTSDMEGSKLPEKIFFTHNIFVCAWNNELPPFPWPKPGSFAQLWKWIKIFQPKNSLKSFYCVLLVFYIFTSKFIGLPALRGGSKVWGSFVCLWMFSLAGWNKILACPSTIIIMDQSSNMRLFDNADFFPAYNHSIKSICQVVYGGIPYLARPLLCQTFAFHRLQSRMEYFWRSKYTI